MAEALLLQGGCLLDPAQGYHRVKKDILMENGRISRIEDRIEPAEGMQVVSAEGYLVSPGFIDIHAHVDTTTHKLGLPADMIGVEQGTTTIIDAGDAGPANIENFVENTIKKSRTRIYAAMHYATDGLQNPPEADDPSKYDLQTGIDAYHNYKDYIVAIKARASQSCVGQLGITSIQAGKNLARAVGLPMLVHIGHMPPTIEDVLNLLDKGDIITHAFHGKDNNLFDEDGQIKPETQAARDRGVLFDVGHGKDSFNFNTGRLARSREFYPDIISTDLHKQSIHKPVYSLSETMDKFMALGYTLEEVVEKVTSQPAKALSLEGLGKLEAGALADITVYDIEDGSYHFVDANKNELNGDKSIRVRYAIVGGKVEMDSQDMFRQLCGQVQVPRRRMGEYEYIYRLLTACMTEKGVQIGEEYLSAFMNHVITLLTRLENGEELNAMDDMDEDSMSEFSPESLAVTDSLFDILEKFYHRPNKSERVLVAIHMQTAINLRDAQ